MSGTVSRYATPDDYDDALDAALVHSLAARASAARKRPASAALAAPPPVEPRARAITATQLEKEVKRLVDTYWQKSVSDSVGVLEK